MSSSVAKRWTRIASRSPYGIGWRTSATLQARVEQRPADLAAGLALAAAGADRADRDDRLRRAASIVAFGPEQRKSAPAASTSDALCITVSCVRSE